MPAGRCQLGKRDTRSRQRKPDRWIRDKDHLSFIRSLPCCVCGRAPCDAAHVRNGTDGAMGRKPSDKWAVPLCSIYPTSSTTLSTGCHGRQHYEGEETFWSRYGDPIGLAEHLWKASGDMEAGMRAVERFRMKLAL